ncbi:hypothetical protein [Polaromonas sp.]|uniref:hypothetical protein n=1 Tax=Polaromonas sp. TaxID=1869339 RepID=UPI0032650FB7
MRLTLLSSAFFSACLTSAAAQPGPSALPAANTSKIVKAKQLAKAPEATTRMKLQPGQEAIKVSAAHTAAPGRPMAQGTVASQPDEPDELPYGTLLATLVLMAAIAVRRSKAGRP